MKLYSYWRSGTSYRTRIALELKEIPYELETVDLRAGQQKEEAYRAINNQGLVPSLVLDDGTCLSQSPAIIEYLDEYKPSPPLLPLLPEDKATVRTMANIIGCDTHPLNNLRVLKYLKNELGQEQAAIDKWAATWIHDAFGALESLVTAHLHNGGTYCFGDHATLADCYLIPQIYSAMRFNVDLSAYPHLIAIHDYCSTLPAFKRAHPDAQPDADTA